jgi:DNA-binding response OmpR family regulator
MRVLIIEDNPDLVANLCGYLEPLGYRLDCVRTGTAGLAAARADDYDVIVIDVMLPGLDGLSLCRRLRADERKATPVLMLTARDTLDDKLRGFASGADDYLVKPFALAELDARLKALVRRARDQHVDTVLRVGELCLDTVAKRLTRAGRRVDLTPTGYRLIASLMQAFPGVVSRRALEVELWGDAPPDSDALRTHIHTLRQAVDKPFARALVERVPGFGYRLAAPLPGDDDAA